MFISLPSHFRKGHSNSRMCSLSLNKGHCPCSSGFCSELHSLPSCPFSLSSRALQPTFIIESHPSLLSMASTALRIKSILSAKVFKAQKKKIFFFPYLVLQLHLMALTSCSLPLATGSSSASLKTSRFSHVLFSTEGCPDGTLVKNPPANAGEGRDAGSIPGSGRCPGIGDWNSSIV